MFLYHWRHRASPPMRAPSPVFPGWQHLCPAPRHQICRLPAWCKSEISGCQPVCLRPVHVRCVHVDATYIFEERHRRSHVSEVPRECIKLLARDEPNHCFFAFRALVTNSTVTHKLQSMRNQNQAQRDRMILRNLNQAQQHRMILRMLERVSQCACVCMGV